MEERLEGFLLGLAPISRAILWIFLILLSCSSSENCCEDAYMISAIFRAAFFCLASLPFGFHFGRLRTQRRPLPAAFPFAP